MSRADRVEAYARGLLEVVAAEGGERATDVEDELFRLGRALEANDALRDALVDPSIGAERRVAILEELLGTRALRVTVAAASLIVAAGRASDLPAIVDRLVELAAQRRNRAVAEVRSAVELDDATVARLTEALSHATGKQVEVKVVVDEQVLGGIVARVGDTVIDGTVRHRLEQLKEHI